MTKLFAAFLLNIIISSSLCAKGLDIQVPVAPAISLETMANSMQEYVDLRSMIQQEQKKHIQSENLLQLRIQFKEQAVTVKDLANNCTELRDDSRQNILEAIKEDECYYPQ